MSREQRGGFAFYRGARKVAAWLVAPFFKLKVFGAEFIPKTQHFILICNHISSWDPIMLAAACAHNDICFMAKESLFKFRPLGWVLQRLNVIKVMRSGTNLGAVRSALTRLKGGYSVGIFPEGHRYRDGKIHPFETGVGLLTLGSDVPVLPAYVSGEYGFRKGVNIHFGSLISLSDLRRLPKDALTVDWIQQRLTRRMVELSKNSPQIFLAEQNK